MNLVRGTRIIQGQEAKDRRILLNKMIEIAELNGFNEIILPSLDKPDTYTDKAGNEILQQMYCFPDKKGRDLCLRPEATATIQLLADKHYKTQKDVKFWYFTRCYRYERPQRGRYREFWQFGLEWINPKSRIYAISELKRLAISMVNLQTSNWQISHSVKRGLDYYIEDGFEIALPELGAQKQVMGGGRYKQGIGFAIGFDRLMLAKERKQ